jgi:hypothetical protein
MTVIRLKPNETCHRCGSNVDLPHRDTHECMSALGREAADLIARTRKIAERRKELIAMQAREHTQRARAARTRRKTSA